ncbi:hypothetical protein ATSB10_37520 [Dyella thiooxydans]|uniref:Uncharacterized protein n=1 Tax=Dyella thiooxydans TaxID=445710 RepID=A0A160N513_9GAMM|nr:hypothetical protein ATSB10_37520 [Dyella thiooxydans]
MKSRLRAAFLLRAGCRLIIPTHTVTSTRIIRPHRLYWQTRQVTSVKTIPSRRHEYFANRHLLRENACRIRMAQSP